jgi:hypothetical protein
MILNEKKLIEIQCISNNCGFYEDLKIGKWYLASDSSDFYKIYNEKIDNKYFLYKSYHIIYDKKLFRTLEQKREMKINQILKYK